MSTSRMPYAMTASARNAALVACMVALIVPGFALAVQAGQATAPAKAAAPTTPASKQPVATTPAAPATSATAAPSTPATPTPTSTPAPVITGTGDTWVDAQLADIDVYAARYRDAFIDEIVRYQGTPRALVVDLLKTPGWTPGDVYYACAISHVIGRPCRAVAEQWTRDRATGWQAVAMAVGVDPGSELAKRIRATLVDSQARWARPAAKVAPQLAPPKQTPAATKAAAAKR